MLNSEIDYTIEKTSRGTWRRYLYPSGHHFCEYKSHATFMGWPVIHYTKGICPETGHRIIAKGLLAVGRIAVGGLAIGQASAGIIAVGQACFGVIFGLGQAAAGLYALGQLAAGLYLAIGQLAVGYIAVGQLAIGIYALGQVGIGKYVWSTTIENPEAKKLFKALFAWVGYYIPF
ncbi:MAG: hypothetical protein GF350_14750 [Chitinivibrionales bacterium]|nr:hypothetical protein [Chitinivibrionales bacterium]